MDIVKELKKHKYKDTQEEMSLLEYLELCRNDPTVYANAAERLVKAIGAPEIIETRHDPKLGRIFSNRTIKKYATFSDFYGMEEAIEQVVEYLKFSAQNLEESKQILYLLGPVGGGKSSLAERLKELMEESPFYAIKDSPVFENPLALVPNPVLADLKIPAEYTKMIPSPWAMKRLSEYKGDITKFKVVKLYPNQLKQIAISKTEPGDENNQDISSLVGKLDIRKLDKFGQDDPDAYSFSGGLCVGNRGLMEFVEMFKAPLKTLHPLLTATQERNYNGTEAIAPIPFEGIILAHSNETEWDSFKAEKKNEAFLDRIYIVKVPYCLRIDEEVKIYEKLLQNSALKDSVCAPKTLSILAETAIMSRIEEEEGVELGLKMYIYNGDNLKHKVTNLKSAYELRERASAHEGMFGLSTRFAYKVLSKTFNFDSKEIAANPVHLLSVLGQQIRKENFDPKLQAFYQEILQHETAEYRKFLEREIKKAFLESYEDYGQNIFDRYVTYTELWLADEDYIHPDTGEILDPNKLDTNLLEIELAAGISNPKDFREEVVMFCYKYKAAHKGENPKWASYNKMREVIEKKIFSNTEELLPIISFSTKSSKAEDKKHNEFVKRMMKNGYTRRQVELMCNWYVHSSRK